MPSLPHKFLQEFFYKNSTKLSEKGQEKRKSEKCCQAHKKKEEKNSCSRFPSVFLILVFSLFLIFFCLCLYSLVAPSDKKEEIRIQLRQDARAIGGRTP